MTRRRRLLVIAAPLLLLSSAPARANDASERLERSREVYQELIQSPDRQVPQALLEQCKCVAVFPHVFKGAFGFGARYGKGFVSCRDAAGVWSPPAPFTLAGGSWGLQIGAESADVVLFFMTEHGAKSLVQSKFTLGATAGLAAGPAGRTAEASTDLKLEAEIYSYARAKGLFAGLSLDGARLAPDALATRQLYGEATPAQTILFEQKVPQRPKVAEDFRAILPPPHATTP